MHACNLKRVLLYQGCHKMVVNDVEYISEEQKNAISRNKGEKYKTLSSKSRESDKNSNINKHLIEEILKNYQKFDAKYFWIR